MHVTPVVVTDVHVICSPCTTTTTKQCSLSCCDNTSLALMSDKLGVPLPEKTWTASERWPRKVWGILHRNDPGRKLDHTARIPRAVWNLTQIPCPVQSSICAYGILWIEDWVKENPPSNGTPTWSWLKATWVLHVHDADSFVSYTLKPSFCQLDNVLQFPVAVLFGEFDCLQLLTAKSKYFLF